MKISEELNILKSDNIAMPKIYSFDEVKKIIKESDNEIKNKLIEWVKNYDGYSISKQEIIGKIRAIF